MLRRLPTTRLLALIAAVLAALGGGTAIAMAALGGSGAKPPAKSLVQALHDATSAPGVQGVTARITFTNHLIDSSSLPKGSNPLLSGATGRLWAAPDGRLRLELQSDAGDAQVTSDGKVLSIFDSTSNTIYRITLPQDASAKTDSGGGGAAPTVTKIQQFLDQLAKHADVSGATPDNVAGRPAYSTRITPKHDGGLIGAAELAWDAANGTPLRAAVYAAGNPNPVLELTATDISFGPVDASALAVTPPAGAKVTKIDLSGAGQDHGATGHAKSGANEQPSDPKQVAAQLPFALSAPDTLVGLPRHDVHAVDLDGSKGALVTYGAGLGGIAVLEQKGGSAGPAAPAQGDRHHQLSLPQISINGASGEELATALGTLVRFERGGVQYTIIGSVPPAAAEAAARAL
jgi:outer membrane lipoprotein-sorting protein